MVAFQITAEDVKAALDKGEKLILIDVREPWEYDVSRIEGSKLIPMGDIPSRAHQELDPDERIIAYCHHGVRSLNVVNWLRQQGFENAQSMSGGIDRWARVVDPKVPVY
jgi:rhodanese-related sulfurtransferase